MAASTGSENTFRFVESKLAHCRKTHKLCRHMSSQTWFPSRILEIGKENKIIHLIEGHEAPSLPYVTLSHCWGTSNPMRLTKDTEAMLRAGVHTGFLPKTYREAISVAGKLSIPYIWIDSLCIFQDSLDDWHREAAHMCEVYSHAVANIAATGASDGSEGLFFERDVRRESSFWVQTNWTPDQSWKGEFAFPPGTYAQIYRCNQWQTDLEQGPLNRRAWVMQERFLSSRILHFSKTLVFFECLEDSSSELFPTGIPPIAKPLWFYDSQRLKRTLFHPLPSKSWPFQLYNEFQLLARAYSRCGLSKESDKLVAMNGIEKLLERIAGVKLVAGLWSERLIQELCWSRDLGSKFLVKGPFYPQKWRAPTFSWAASQVEIHPVS